VIQLDDPVDRNVVGNEKLFLFSKKQKPATVNIEYRWRLHGITFWNIHLIANSKRLKITLGKNQVIAL